jgi:hypothetical protein
MAYELPYILYDNDLEDGTLTVTSEESGFPKENLLDWLDWTYWKSTSAAQQNIDVFFASPNVGMDTGAILGHNLGTAGNSLGTQLRILNDDNPSFSSPDVLYTATITDDNPFYFDIGQLWTEQYFRFEITNLDEACFIAVAFLGPKLTMPVGPEFSFDPDMQNVMSERFSSYSGRMVSSAVQFVEREMDVPFMRLSQTFVANSLLPFLEDHYGQMIPFFFVPDPGNFFGTDKIYYVVAPDNPSISIPVRSDDKNYRDWTLVAQGIRQSTFR